MAWDATTVTPPNPTPPTNMGFVGSTPPNPFNYADEVYEGDEDAPFFDDGTAGSLTEFVSAHPSLEVGGTSVEHEGRGTEVVVTAPGSRAECPTKSFSCLGSYTSTPNASHPSAAAPAVAPEITGLVPVAPTTTGGTEVLTVNGTGFRGDSVVHLDGVPQTTQYVSDTQLKVMTARKRTSAGNVAVTVVTGGTATEATNWVFA